MSEQQIPIYLDQEGYPRPRLNVEDEAKVLMISWEVEGRSRSLQYPDIIQLLKRLQAGGELSSKEAAGVEHMLNDEVLITCGYGPGHPQKL